MDVATHHKPVAAKHTPGGGTPFIKKPWFWVAAGLIIVVVAVVVVVVVLASSNNNFFSPPSPSAASDRLERIDPVVAEHQGAIQIKFRRINLLCENTA
jgi:hypothetical protein